MVENVFANFFPKRMNIIDIRLSGFCTNEVGFLLDTSLCDSSSRNAAIIGNPLRHVSFDDNSETKLLNFTGSANLIDKNCNGKYLSIVSGPNICVFDLHKGAILREFHGHDGAILNVAWHHTNPWLLASVGIDSTLRLWDLRLHPAQLQMRRTPRPFTCLEYSPDCSYIACGGQIISVFDLNMSQSVQYMPCTSPTTNIRFNPAECLLATSHEDHSVCFWDIDTGECVTQSPSFDSKVGQICFPPDGKYLIVNNGKKICTIQWEPFQLISQVLFPFCGHFPSHNISIQFPNKSEEYTPLTHLDMKVRDELIFGLSIVNEDSQKIGTACLSTIRLDKLDCYSTDNSTILDCVEYTSKSIDYENNDFEIQDQFDVTQITAQEKTSAAIIPESSLASDKLVKNVESVEELAPKTLIQNRPTALVLSDNISTSFESAGSICHSSSASARSSIYNLLSPTAIHNKNISSKINCKTIKQQKESLKASTELKSNNLSGKRPNKLPLINQNQQKHLDSYNCHEGQKPSNYNPNQLFRRGSSLTDVSDPAKNNNNMPMENNRHKSESDSGDELEEFLQFDPKVRANILKRVRDIKAVFTRSNRISGDTCEFIIKETIRFDDILAYAFLLKQYMDRGSFSMSSNELFLSRADALLVHRNKSYIQLGLNFLNMVTSRFGNAILHGLASQEFIIGVDVEAEKRFERCTKCKNALFQIRLNTAFNMERMTFAQRNLFEKEILPRIDEIVNAERSPDVRHFSNNT